MGDALKIALVTVSDTRTAENDTSGDYLADALSGVGHELVDRVVVIVLEWDSTVGFAVGVAAVKSQHKHDIFSLEPFSKLSLMNLLFSMPAT